MVVVMMKNWWYGCPAAYTSYNSVATLKDMSGRIGSQWSVVMVVQNDCNVVNFFSLVCKVVVMMKNWLYDCPVAYTSYNSVATLKDMGGRIDHWTVVMSRMIVMWSIFFWLHANVLYQGCQGLFFRG